MSVTGLCQICERGEAVHQCPRCGALVCETHWDAGTGRCVECAAETRGREDAGTGPR
jgi:hypothetical protein